LITVVHCPDGGI